MDIAIPADQNSQEEDPEARVVRFYICKYKARDLVAILGTSGMGMGLRGGCRTGLRGAGGAP
jgi:hypothetical protein